MVHEDLEGVEEPWNEGFDLETAVVICSGAGVERSDVPPGPLIAQEHGFYIDAGARAAPVVDKSSPGRSHGPKFHFDRVVPVAQDVQTTAHALFSCGRRPAL